MQKMIDCLGLSHMLLHVNGTSMFSHDRVNLIVQGRFTSAHGTTPYCGISVLAQPAEIYICTDYSCKSSQLL